MSAMQGATLHNTTTRARWHSGVGRARTPTHAHTSTRTRWHSGEVALHTPAHAHAHAHVGTVKQAQRIRQHANTPRAHVGTAERAQHTHHRKRTVPGSSSKNTLAVALGMGRRRVGMLNSTSIVYTVPVHHGSRGQSALFVVTYRVCSRRLW